jgi:hypothetical protein
MKTLNQMLDAAHADANHHEYLRYSLLGKDEIGRFAREVRDAVIDECAQAVGQCGSIEQAVAVVTAMKVARA